MTNLKLFMITNCYYNKIGIDRMVKYFEVIIKRGNLCEKKLVFLTLIIVIIISLLVMNSYQTIKVERALLLDKFSSDFNYASFGVVEKSTYKAKGTNSNKDIEELIDHLKELEMKIITDSDIQNEFKNKGSFHVVRFTNKYNERLNIEIMNEKYIDIKAIIDKGDGFTSEMYINELQNTDNIIKELNKLTNSYNDQLIDSYSVYN